MVYDSVMVFAFIWVFRREKTEYLTNGFGVSQKTKAQQSNRGFVGL
jgi:hypothetical protein